MKARTSNAVNMKTTFRLVPEIKLHMHLSSDKTLFG